MVVEGLSAVELADFCKKKYYVQVYKLFKQPYKICNFFFFDRNGIIINLYLGVN